MVAYSFQRRFVGHIVAGLEPGPWRPGMKRQTLRLPRQNNRHARPGQALQLYAGMRTRHCRLLGRAVCQLQAPVRLVWQQGQLGLMLRAGTVHLPLDDTLLPPEIARLAAGDALCGVAMEWFSQAEGFGDAAEMARFFDAPPTPDHCVHYLPLTLIAWVPAEENGR